jgi:hypothetical protein
MDDPEVLAMHKEACKFGDLPLRMIQVPHQPDTHANFNG